MISFIIPAHNEAALIGATVRTLRQAIDDLALNAEVIVVNDNSTDATGDIARAAGATVLDVSLRQIGAVRNAGALHAQGERLVFVDADTLVPQPTITAGFAALDRGAIAAGCHVAWDAATPFVPLQIAEIFLFGLRLGRVMPGCCIFVARADFEAVGGFDEAFFAAEEVWLSRTLAKRGRIAFVWPPVVSSGRKFREFGAVGLFIQAMRTVIKGTRKRSHLNVWYEAGREDGPPSK